MKKLSIITTLVGVVLLAVSCKNNYLDLKPEDQLTEASYFKSPDQFKAYSGSFYNKMISWQPIDGSNVYDFMDNGSDLSANVTVNAEGGYAGYGRGSINPKSDDQYWNNPYTYIRAANVLLAKADAYTGDKGGIKQYIAEAKFFRAWQHFFLLQ